MKLKRPLVFLSALFTLAMLSMWMAVPTFADPAAGVLPSLPQMATPGLPPIVTTLSPTTIIISVLSLLAGYVAQSVNTGLLFGKVVIPQPWLPWLTLVASFLAAFTASIIQAPEQNQVAWFNAALAGFISLMGHSAGAAARGVVSAHLRVPTMAPPPAPIVSKPMNDVMPPRAS